MGSIIAQNAMSRYFEVSRKDLAIVNVSDLRRNMPINMIGFARTIAGLVEFTIIVLVVIGAVWGLLRTFVFPPDDDDNDEPRRILNIAAIILVIAFAINFIISAVSLSISNRTPRQDLDRSEIYQQMESNKSGNK